MSSTRGAGPGRPRLVEPRRRGATAREEILDASAELFVRHGYSGTSTVYVGVGYGGYGPGWGYGWAGGYPGYRPPPVIGPPPLRPTPY